MKTIGECRFNKNGVCTANVCYDGRGCSAKDWLGNPKYSSGVKK